MENTSHFEPQVKFEFVTVFLRIPSQNASSGSIQSFEQNKSYLGKLIAYSHTYQNVTGFPRIQSHFEHHFLGHTFIGYFMVGASQP